MGVLNLALRVRSDLSGCLSNGACAFNLWSTAMLARPLRPKDLDNAQCVWNLPCVCKIIPDCS